MCETTLLFYKPYGVLCQFTNPGDTPEPRLTLKDFIALPDFYPAGRLDFDSEGLLLLTNHGPLQHRLAHRQFAHARTYWVQVERIPADSDLEPLRQGIRIQDYHTRPAQVHRLEPEPLLPPRQPPVRYRKSVPTSWLELTLTEGRNRQVRRMTAAIGFPTLRLVRVAMTVMIPQRRRTPQPLTLTLEGLQPGQWRWLTPTEGQWLQRLG
ncbi:pseudouridine synthase [Synechocystis sp. LKSZ1]|uniref:pseudouridine synthase n=1 Tax=Synechocystis sp. LKSZ1 TaxID=3144951 RepID=UPI00336BE9CF